MCTVEIIDKMSHLIRESKKNFLSGVDNGEQKAVDFFISELVNTMQEDSMLIRPSQAFGILRLLRKDVPNIRHKVRIDYVPDNIFELSEEGQIWLDLSWEGSFPGTGPVPKCFI